MSKYTLRDTFNNRTISNHRSLEAAVKAEHKFSLAVKRANGQSSYIPTEILKDGERLSDREADQAYSLHCEVSGR
jgi:hypothetical protein